MLRRSTFVISDRISERRVRDELAQAGSSGHGVLTFAQLASRLAGGFARPVSSVEIRSALREPPIDSLSSLRKIAELPGFARAAARTLGAAWLANIDLAANAATFGERWAELAELEAHVRLALTAGAHLPRELVALALKRVELAPTLLGDLTLERLDTVPPLYRELLGAVSERVAVRWRTPLLMPPAWLPAAVQFQVEPRLSPRLRVFSCADPEHETLEALRWARLRLSEGYAPSELAITAVNVAAYDDSLRAVATSAGLPVHAVHGQPALSTPQGQALAALADLLVRGLEQSRLRRFVSAAQSADVEPLAALPDDWCAELQPDAALLSVAQWRRALQPMAAREPQQAAIIERLTADATGGIERAQVVGERWLRGAALELWRRALADGPVGVIEQSLGRLRVDDGVDPAGAVLWGSASALLGWPRPRLRMLGLSARSWPRRGGDDDPLLPQRLLPGKKLRERSNARIDTEMFDALLASTEAEVSVSWPRRGDDGRRQTPSPLLHKLASAENIELRPGDGATHAVTEADRRAARPAELERDPSLRRARDAYRNARSPELSAHDGLVRAEHPAILRSLARRHSATSLKLLLRNPHAFVARYALGWQQPSPQQELLKLEPVDRGSLLHDLLEAAVDRLSDETGRLSTDPSTVNAVLTAVSAEVGAAWAAQRPVPPPALWAAELATIRSWAVAALIYPLESFPTQRSYAEVRFGDPAVADAAPLTGPWDSSATVILPGTDLRLRGVIDRLDLDPVGKRVRVVDYKSGQPAKEDNGVSDGKELQRAIYTAAVRALLGPDYEVEALLLHPRQEVVLPLHEPDAQLQQLSQLVLAGVKLLKDGKVLAGPDLDSGYDETVLAYPAYGAGTYLATKQRALARERAPLEELMGPTT